ncbi:hypothetical protein [Leptospira alexanderi]|uniref:hypothetical protein n=1 Tax=Leptospira alexanderi TaxID=100053 RepID=UPI001FD411C9|nr:hypothetical protein [Leptospira alexanderi]
MQKQSGCLKKSERGRTDAKNILLVQSSFRENVLKVSVGTILDATIIEVPKPKNTKEENSQVKRERGIGKESK